MLRLYLGPSTILRVELKKVVSSLSIFSLYLLNKILSVIL